MKRHVPTSMAAVFGLIEQNLFKGPWAMGPTYTVCDPYLFTIAGWLDGDQVDITRFPKVADHFARMSERPAVRRVLAMIEAG
jgi:glutathione S-transferase